LPKSLIHATAETPYHLVSLKKVVLRKPETNSPMKTLKEEARKVSNPQIAFIMCNIFRISFQVIWPKSRKRENYSSSGSLKMASAMRTT
jgi:hypothetical protein